MTSRRSVSDFSADFCDDRGRLIFPDIGLSLLAGVPRLSHGFLPGYQAEYSPFQLADYDVLISLKPKVTAQSLRGITRLCAIGRCGVGYDNVDLDACTEHGIAVYITPGGVVRPVAEAILLVRPRALASAHHQRPHGAPRQLGGEHATVSAVSLAIALLARSVWATLPAEAVRLLRMLDVAQISSPSIPMRPPDPRQRNSALSSSRLKSCWGSPTMSWSTAR